MPKLPITALGHRGEGVAEFAGRRLFVPFTVPGDEVEVSAEGLVLSVVPSGTDRVPAFCPHFTLCGGCALQHVAPSLYAALKRSLVETALRRAGVDAEVGPLLDARGRGRRRATMHARGGRAGFMARHSHDLRDIDSCPILVPALARAPDLARAAWRLAGDCDVGITATETGLDVDVRPLRTADAPRLTRLAGQFELARVALNGEPVAMVRPPVVRMGTAVVALPPAGFLQATAAAEEMLAGLVREAVGESRAVLDLFCGVGPFALRLGETARVTAADSDEAAVGALERAARSTQGLKPVTALVRDLYRNPLAPAELTRFDAVVLDPPRAGAAAQASELAASRVGTLAYVSCDPQTFARDARVLVAGGFRLEQVTPLDQFAYSTHVEVVGVFRR